jgi:serine protease Do
VVYRAEKDGVIVSTVDPNGAAADVIKVADIIIEFDGKPISDMDVLIEHLYSHKIGDKVSITVWRNGEAVEVSVVLGVGN